MTIIALLGALLLSPAVAQTRVELVPAARPGGRLIVLVEGYTGWTLRGWQAVKYLADRGLDPEALAAKDVGPAQVEVRGWDTQQDYEASKHPLLENPRLSAAGLARPRLRRSLREALAGRSFWAGTPPAGGVSAPR